MTLPSPEEHVRMLFRLRDDVLAQLQATRFRDRAVALATVKAMEYSEHFILPPAEQRGIAFAERLGKGDG